MNPFLRAYLRVLAAFTLIAAIGHLVFPMRVGLASAWGFAPGWQREIGFWDLSMYIIIAMALRSNDVKAGRIVTIGLVLLQILAATNHAFAAMRTHSMLNATLAILNVLCVALGVTALPHRGQRIDKENSPSPGMS